MDTLKILTCMSGSCSSLWSPLWWNWSYFHPEANRKWVLTTVSGGRFCQAVHLASDLKEGECCPLQETFCIADFCMEFLWGANKRKMRQTLTYTNAYTLNYVDICNLFWPSVKLLVKLDLLRCLMEKVHRTVIPWKLKWVFLIVFQQLCTALHCLSFYLIPVITGCWAATG